MSPAQISLMLQLNAPAEHSDRSTSRYFLIRFISVVFPQPFLPTMMFTPGLNSYVLPFLNAFSLLRYSMGVSSLLLITTFVTIRQSSFGNPGSCSSASSMR